LPAHFFVFARWSSRFIRSEGKLHRAE
jgi:hypothetical protein